MTCIDFINSWNRKEWTILKKNSVIRIYKLKTKQKKIRKKISQNFELIFVVFLYDYNLDCNYRLRTFHSTIRTSKINIQTNLLIENIPTNLKYSSCQSLLCRRLI